MRAIVISCKFLIICTLFFSSCEKEANINIPDSTPKLVLYSIISPSDTVLYANIDVTRNLYTNYWNSKRHSFESLKVSFLDGDSAFQFTQFDTIGLQFKLKRKVYPGREYKITASCNGFENITATCKVPAYKQIEISVDTVNGPEGISYMRIHLRDFSDELSYYLVSAYQTEFHSYGTDSTTDECRLWNYDEILKYPFSKSQFYQDDYPSGKLFTTEFSYNYYNLVALAGLDITGVVLETDKNYYLYYESLKKYKRPANPFVEFSQVYSNVSGGYGVFACYNRYEKRLKFKKTK